MRHQPIIGAKGIVVIGVMACFLIACFFSGCSIEDPYFKFVGPENSPCILPVQGPGDYSFIYYDPQTGQEKNVKITSKDGQPIDLRMLNLPCDTVHSLHLVGS